VDVIMRDQLLPEDLQADFVYVPNAGAYTTAYASNFNGFPLPQEFRRRLAGADARQRRAVGALSLGLG
jgi:hypothetical protein